MKFQDTLSVLALLGSTSAQSFFPARPPSIPLAVKSPYLSTWLPVGSDGGDGASGGLLAEEWPVFWHGQTNGWTGMVRVDGVSYAWMGFPGPDPVEQDSFEYTSTKSVFTMNVNDQVGMNITFLSPVYPHDLKRQSLIMSYMNVDVWSKDDSSHNVQVYADISAEWVSGDLASNATWSYDTSGDIAYHSVERLTQLAFSEIDDKTEFGTHYWATDNDDGLTYMQGVDEDVRGTFSDNGTLPNQKDSNYRQIGDEFPVFAFAKDLGSVGDDTASMLFTIGLAQNENIQFAGADGYAPLPSLWTSYFDDAISSLEFFHGDYDHATSNSEKLDSQIQSDSVAAIDEDYAAITALALRQAFAGWQLSGTKEKHYLFLKEISSDGNVNTVDVIFPAFPILLYTNPQLVKMMLDPLYINQEAGNYPNTYSMHDLGSAYPNATGHPDGDDEEMPLEECGNMLIMTLSYAQKTGHTSYLTKHYDLLKQWVGYLVEEALIPADQLSTDDFAGTLANQTDLALKGIIGIEAFSQIAKLTGNSDDASNYTGIAHNYISKWQDFGIATGGNMSHTTLAYGENDTHGLLYNLYADRLLSLDLVPQSVYDMQSAFYPTVANEYGVPLDTRHEYTKTDWEMWVASISSESTRDMFVQKIKKWISETPTNMPWSDLYDTNTADFGVGTGFTNRPVIGGMFAPLALPSDSGSAGNNEGSNEGSGSGSASGRIGKAPLSNDVNNVREAAPAMYNVIKPAEKKFQHAVKEMAQ